MLARFPLGPLSFAQQSLLRRCCSTAMVPLLLLVSLSIDTLSQDEAPGKKPVVAPGANVRWIWTDTAPGESTRHLGEELPTNAREVPKVTRVTKITAPTLSIHVPEKPIGLGLLILPGGGFSKVVPDKEGTEAAKWLNSLGIAAFVLSYRTSEASTVTPWEKPLQDAQRAMSWIRFHEKEFQLKPGGLGLLGFSAGGQVAMRLLCNPTNRSYTKIDAIDDVPFQPDLALLIYPWNCYDPKNDRLVDGMVVPKKCPPTFLVHTDDDRSSSLGTVLFYTELKRLGIPSELHVYGNGGHGYGMRPVEGSKISTWTDHASHWLQTRFPSKSP